MPSDRARPPDKLVEMRPRRTLLGVSGIRISEDELVEVASAAEKAAQERLRRIGGRRVRDAQVTVEAQVEEDGTLTIAVDVSAAGEGLGLLSYDELVEEAVDEAFQAAEDALRRLVSRKKGDQAPR